MNFLSYLINGISLGSVYAIIALGYTMVYGIAKMLNFAHGDVIMIGAYVALITMKQAGLPTWVAILISIIACTVLGVLMERVAYKPLRNATSSLAVLITATYAPIMITSPCAKFNILAIPYTIVYPSAINA